SGFDEFDIAHLAQQPGRQCQVRLGPGIVRIDNCIDTGHGAVAGADMLNQPSKVAGEALSDACFPRILYRQHSPGCALCDNAVLGADPGAEHCVDSGPAVP
ncbi:hypothetical protein HDU99_001137, partial [Rhizoclosmatium hyalinum]